MSTLHEGRGIIISYSSKTWCSVDIRLPSMSRSWKNPLNGIKRSYKGGMYHPSPSVLKRLDDETIVVDDTLRYYPYRATFDFECYFNTANLPPDSNTAQWLTRHILLGVSIVSNTLGHETPQCYVTDGDVDKLVEAMTTFYKHLA